MKITYPILNISILQWNNDIVEEIFRENDIYYSSDEEFFQLYLLGHEFFVDCNGNLYKLVNKVPINNYLTRILSSKKSRFLFEATGNKITFHDLQQLMINRIQDLDGDEARQNWKNKLKNAKEIKNLIQ